MVQFNIGGLTLGKTPVIKSVQYGSITLDEVKTNTATINSVSTENSYIIHLGEQISNSSGNFSLGGIMARIDLTNTTTVTATRDGLTGDLIVKFCVVEFTPGVVKNIQNGTIHLEGDSQKTNTATITAVNTNKAFLINRGLIASSVAQDEMDESSRVFTNLYLTNTTTVTATRDFEGFDSFNDVDIGYTVVEFY